MCPPPKITPSAPATMAPPPPPAPSSSAQSVGTSQSAPRYAGGEPQAGAISSLRINRTPRKTSGSNPSLNIPKKS